ncbi:glucosyl-dolichyl phosphate glucuronosyltransferase [Halalkalicoccus sp. NIPERK01]|uniref:glucosyl-dolichyl phosphate glucuronosyltransferase n=1 Tax=Halalkalicoccus sp. NIPERK01 TaxID=3053469 RepID=UPI00256F4707|nr:glucosyl-dolichyl phosphate glucuronosyltransferase [Halalkalicoccus sp. NIPERK01]MDL5360559.1 glucosyl-dolichyl phosphate glucuronosyltransferase [Halalkalicoccus sp. NIPERK01]
MKVSVVVCTYSMERYDAFSECVESVLDQTHEPLEVVLVVDGNETVFERVCEDFGGRPDVVVYDNDENRGISYSRTKGAELASGEIVAFIDDDAVAEPNWIEKLVRVYEGTDAVAVGGHVAPDWVTEKPDFFPEEFYWLVGCTEKGFAKDGEEVRNTYGSNISFKRDVFLDVGGYDPNTGRKGDRHVQAHEAPVGIRIREQYGRGMIYVTDALVHHKLFDYRGDFRWLVFRSFWQGYSKRVMDLLYEETYGDEGDFLTDLFVRYLPERAKRAVLGPSLTEVKRIVAILAFTGAVGLGYLYGLFRRDVLREKTTSSKQASV